MNTLAAVAGLRWHNLHTMPLFSRGFAGNTGFYPAPWQEVCTFTGPVPFFDVQPTARGSKGCGWA
jgi:hypothetical protein